jgi:hypothetical protein
MGSAEGEAGMGGNMYKVTYKESDWNEIYECGNINMVAALIVDLVNRKGYDESNFKIEWVN